MSKASERAIGLAREVLAKLTGYDPRFPKPNDATLLAWSEHISLHNPDREDMLAAVSKFYSTPRDRVPLPADISSLAREMRRERMARGEYQPPPDRSADPPIEIPGSKPITMAEWEKLHGRFPTAVPARTVDGDRVRYKPPTPPQYEAFEGNPLLVACPWCHASVGEPCTVPGMPGKARERMKNLRGHPSRLEAAGAEPIPESPYQ